MTAPEPYCPYGFPTEGEECCGGYCGMDTEDRPPKTYTEGDVQALVARLAEVEAERDHWRNGWKRAMGEFDAKCKEANAQRARAEAAEAENAKLVAALIWCSGSNDFQDGGEAREGWLKLCAPLIQPAALQEKQP